LFSIRPELADVCTRTWISEDESNRLFEAKKAGVPKAMQS